MQSIAFEQTIRRSLEVAGLAMVGTPRDRATVDCVFIDSLGNHIAVEVKGYGFHATNEQLEQLARAVSSLSVQIRRFVLVTPFEPDCQTLQLFMHTLVTSQRAVQWLSAYQFGQAFGLDEFALSENVPRRRRHGGDILFPIHLNRQLSPELLTSLEASAKPAETFLRVGERVPVLVALSDIKSFSYLVKAARPDDLNDAMSKYYRLARDLVWGYGGVLDKFIGDAVLAIFSYPSAEKRAPVNATKFAADLIEVGRPILGGLKDLINEAIDTGTRVGISTGEISVLNIGLQTIELSFVGDVINLAARLEHECEVDGCLIDNLTKVAISKSDTAFFESLSLVGRKLDRERVKGQLTSIQAWQIPPVVISAISNIDAQA